MKRTLLLSSVILFALLSLLVHSQKGYFSVDLIITKNIQLISVGWFDILMRFITDIGYVGPASVIIALVVAFCLSKGMIEEVIIFLVSSYGSVYLSEVIKSIVGRPRPDPSLIVQLGQFDKPDSFPSGHVLFAIGLYGFLAYLSRKYLKKSLQLITLYMCILMIILMGLSRIYLGAHWFSDVLGSYLLGFAWIHLMVYIYHLIKSKNSKNQDL